MEPFSEWNLRLLRSFFSEASGGEEVFLRVDRDLLDQIGQEIGGDRGFLEAVRRGPEWLVTGSSLVSAVRTLVWQRSMPAMRPVNYIDPGRYDPVYRRVHAPAYLPYLAALVRNDTEHPRGYYEGLKIDLQLEHVFRSGEMEQLELAWKDLQRWTEELKGKYGRFRLRTLGGYSRIGIPRSQSILHNRDIEELPRAFVESEISPSHELDESEVTRILNEVRASSSSYSAAFSAALNNSDFEQPIRAAIVAAYAEWDGTIPPRGNSGQVKNASTQQPEWGQARLGLCLAVKGDEPVTLVPMWQVPSLQDSGYFQLNPPDSEVVWEGAFTGTDGSVSKHAPHNVDNIWQMAKRAYHEPLRFDVQCFSSEDSEPTTVAVLLPRRQLWVLTARRDGVSGEIVLHEGMLPGSGQAFLLACPENVNRLKEYLSREKPKHSIIAAQEFPADWLLVRLHECGDLTSDQRRLPDGSDGTHPKPRAIRFVGGRSVRRGYSRMYLWYDPPCLELDAPEGARLEVPAGLTLREEEGGCDSRGQESDAKFQPRRRFQVEVNDSKSASYELRAWVGSELLGKAKLRVAGHGGELVDNQQAHGVDHVGRPTPSGEGLSGIAPSVGVTELPTTFYEDPFRFATSCLGSSRSNSLQRPGAREKFLDSLAQSGSLAYGTARDQIARLLGKDAEGGDPPLILLELRSQGHLEISMTHKGHMSRVHAVEPTVYELPVAPDGKHAYGVTGTLRLSHWAWLVEELGVSTSFCGQGRSTGLKPLRLLANSHETMHAECKRLALRFSSSPALKIAKWSSGITTIREEIFSNPMESIGSAQVDAVRFNASKGRFTAHPAFGDVIELWKIRDLDTGMDNVHVLYDHDTFAFVRASRWGVWIALNAFAEWVERLPGMEGVYPIPVTYSRSDGTLWLPARISLPFVLERALVLCSGSLPEVFELKHSFSNGRLHLSTAERSHAFLTVKRFYEQMATGKWLAYQWVPEVVAREVVEKLGATLDIT
ncbi:hypothetical protein [Spiribacter onubensis]|uniref:DUF3893 domain-containing protein n=1 Tax=Spiribacter onubensis TaxID=3122420 RepID=A0ABV3S7B4_9GAMM